MAKTPECKKCGARHYQFDSCPSMTGTLEAPLEPGLRVIRGAKSNASLIPFPPGWRSWSDNDGPKAA
jgi:hypothetical protein